MKGGKNTRKNHQRSLPGPLRTLGHVGLLGVTNTHRSRDGNRRVRRWWDQGKKEKGS